MSRPEPDAFEHEFDRYRRQTRFLGPTSSEQLASAVVSVVGLGAVGGLSADLLVRAGVGELRLIDRDLVENHNLHRQTLFDESDAANESPKAEAAANRLQRINSTVRLIPTVAELSSGNIRDLVAGSSLVLDGTDNFATRYLINDYCVREGIPWISAGCLGASGQVVTVLPGETPCLRCILPDCPPVGSTPTCETAGVIGPAVAVVAGLQAAEALKILIGEIDRTRRGLIGFDLWKNEIHSVATQASSDPACPCCQLRRFDFLSAPASETYVRLCGQAVQISPPAVKLKLAELGQRLKLAGEVVLQRHLLKFRNAEASLTIFHDGRTLVHGVDDFGRAQALRDRYLGR